MPRLARKCQHHNTRFFHKIPTTHRHIIKPPPSNPIQLIQNIPQLPRARSIATRDLQLRKSLLNRRIQYLKKVFRLIPVRKHAGIVPWVEIRLIVSPEHRNRHILLFLVEPHDLHQVVCVRLPPIGGAVAAAHAAEQAAVALVVVGFHAARGAPGVGVDEEVGVVLEGGFGEVHLAGVVTVPGVVEGAGGGCWTGAEDGAVGGGLDEVADDGQGADVFVEEGFGYCLLVGWGEAGGTELVAWLFSVSVALWMIRCLTMGRLTGDTESS